MRFVFLSGCLLLTSLIAGCSAPGAAPVYEAPTPAASATAGGVSFHGPWASALAETYRNLDDADLRAAVADGRITDDELAAAEASVTACLAKRDVKGSYDDHGNISFSNTDDSDDATVDRCVTTAGGTVVSLRHAMDRNPENLDDTTIIFRCIQRAGIVQSSYSLTEFNRDSGAGSFPFDPDAREFTKCLDDPLGSYRR